jgi:hypothetical protein
MEYAFICPHLKLKVSGLTKKTTSKMTYNIQRSGDDLKHRARATAVFWLVIEEERFWRK